MLSASFSSCLSFSGPPPTRARVPPFFYRHPPPFSFGSRSHCSLYLLSRRKCSLTTLPTMLSNLASVSCGLNAHASIIDASVSERREGSLGTHVDDFGYRDVLHSFNVGPNSREARVLRRHFIISSCSQGRGLIIPSDQEHGLVIG